MPLSAILVFALAGCRVDLDPTASQEAAATVASIPATPPPAPGPAGEKAYQILYAGEYGARAQPAGQRARVLAWLHSCKFDTPQLGALLELAARVAAMDVQQAQALAQLDAAEAALVPAYDELVALYANGAVVGDAQLAPIATQLEAARGAAYGGRDPKQQRYDQVYSQVEVVLSWVSKLPQAQAECVGDSRFFLQRKLGPFTNPGDYGYWLGTAWNGGDFASLKTGGRPAQEGQMNIGGLWSTDDMEMTTQAGGLRLREAVLLLFAVQDSAFRGAVEVRMGRRAPGDYGE